MVFEYGKMKPTMFHHQASYNQRLSCCLAHWKPKPSFGNSKPYRPTIPIFPFLPPLPYKFIYPTIPSNLQSLVLSKLRFVEKILIFHCQRYFEEMNIEKKSWDWLHRLGIEMPREEYIQGLQKSFLDWRKYLISLVIHKLSLENIKLIPSAINHSTRDPKGAWMCNFP